jgi:hypothetical protein
MVSHNVSLLALKKNLMSRVLTQMKSVSLAAGDIQGETSAHDKSWSIGNAGQPKGQALL